MNPSYVNYSDTGGSPSENMIFLNSGVSSFNSPLTGIPLPSPAENSELRHHNLWAPASSSFGLGTQKQGLSLSLSSQQTPAYMYRPEEIMGAPAIAGAGGIQSFLMNSKYLKAARELLDEMASVGNGGGLQSPKKAGENIPAKCRTETEANREGETCRKRETELSSSERQDLQMKKAKLLSMLDEVEQRYQQYHRQMRLIASAFEAVAGDGSAKTYTALALRTISRQFRCLRDAISGEIRAAGKNLGEEDFDLRPARGGPKSVGSRLRLVDHHLRQQRALQQLGMMQPNGWRPQRGLPERAVSVLRAWLFEHFLHPYPKDSDKLMLAKQTGLTRSQVSNWFINARVRLWKPMVEEMYVEEIKEQDQNNNNRNHHHNLDQKRTHSEVNDESTSKPISQPKAEHSHPNPSSAAIPSANFGTPREEDTFAQPFSKKAMRFHGGSYGGDYSVDGTVVDQHFGQRFHGNGVSLTLGLPHCDSMSFAGGPPAFLSGEEMAAASAGQQASSSYGRIEMQSSRRFAAQLLPDFVA